MEEWKEYRLGEVTTSIQTGPFGSQLHMSDYSDEGIPVVMPKDMLNGKISEISIARVSEEHVNRLSRHKVADGDILYARRGDIGRCVYISEKENGWLCGTGCLKLEIDRNKADPMFLFLQLQNPSIISLIENRAVGATMPNLNTEILKKVSIKLPPLPTQQKIASILSAYDNLIQNYKKQIEALQTAASELYKEWFVRFRFPGYQTAEFENGIPEGWRIETANKLFNITIGKTPPRAEQEWFSTSENDVKWVSISDMNQGLFIENTNEKLTKAAVDKFHVITVPKDTVLLSFKLTIGKVSITKFEVTTNEAIAHFHLPDLNWREYIYNYLAEFPYQKLGNTSAIGTAINSQIVKKMNIVVPDDIILKKYHKKAGDIFNKISLLGNQIANLTQQRDLLLPRLMSGKLEVE